MALIVQKYGGSSVGSIEKIKDVGKRIEALKKEGNQIVVVISAMQGITDHLFELASKISDNPNERELDNLLATGEQQSIALLTMTLNKLGVSAISMTGKQAGIQTTGSHTRGRIQQISPQLLLEELAKDQVVVVAGFQGATEKGWTQTLGRGGSDLTAIAIASSIKADQCQILTDVEGVFTCDPLVVPKAQKIEQISYDEMLEMSSSGTKVMQSRSVEVAKKYSVSFEVCSSFKLATGTQITEETKNMESVVVRGISIEKNQARITLSGIPDKPGYSAKILNVLAEAEVNIDIIVSNNTHDGNARHSFTMATSDIDRTEKALQPLLESVGIQAKIETESPIAKLSVVGIGMRSHSGIAATLFQALGDAQINIGMISTSEIKITVTLNQSHIEKAAQIAHHAFGLDKT